MTAAMEGTTPDITILPASEGQATPDFIKEQQAHTEHFCQTELRNFVAATKAAGMTFDTGGDQDHTMATGVEHSGDENEARPTKRQKKAASATAAKSKQTNGPVRGGRTSGTKKKSKAAMEAMERFNNMSIMGSDIFVDSERMQDIPAQPIWDSTTRRQDAFHKLGELGGSADKKVLESACKEFGRMQIRPGDNGQWWVKGMKSQLQNHQVIGTAFMIRRESPTAKGARGGILADHMGMGKTIMALALIVNQLKKKDNPSTGPTLIVAPAGLTKQWYDEVAKHCDLGDKGRIIDRYKIFRNNQDRHKEDPVAYHKSCDIVITSFEEVMNSYPVMEPPAEIQDPSEREAWSDEFFAENKGTLHRIDWHRLIVDEAHNIRNPNTKRFKAVNTLRARFKWALTGTPCINWPSDLFALLECVCYPHGYSFAKFRQDFDAMGEEAERKLAEILSACFLRRTLSSKLFNAKIIDLPRASSTVIRTDFTPVERAIYDIVEKRFGERAQSFAASGALTLANRSVYVLLLRLRQLTAHPLILQLDIVDMLERSDLEALRELVTKDADNQDKVGQLLIPRLSDMLRKRHTVEQHIQDKDMVVKIDNHDSPGEPSARQRTGFGSRARFEQFIETLLEEDSRRELEAVRLCVYCRNIATEPRVTECLHIYCKDCVEEAHRDAAELGLPAAECNGCGQVYGATDAVDDSVARVATRLNPKKHKKKPFNVQFKEWFGVKCEFLPSSKTMAVMAHLKVIREQDPNGKVLIYTQWLLMLRILECICKFERHSPYLYSGEMSHDDRDKIVKEFDEHQGHCVLICSLKAGGLGLNLTSATWVINIDQWWNNAVENQAFGRVHRIGQTKETAMVRVVVNDSIDTRMEEIKTRKQVSIDRVQGKDEEMRNEKGLTSQDLLKLFGVTKFDDEEKVTETADKEGQAVAGDNPADDATGN